MERFSPRKPNRLKKYDYSKNGAYFVTICSKDHTEIFGRIVGVTVPGRPSFDVIHPPYVELSEIGKILDGAINHNHPHGVKIDSYVIMPNHVHMIVVISSEMGDSIGTNSTPPGRVSLQMIIRNMKAYVTKQIGFSPWQKSFHDHIIRNENDYTGIAEYIQNNPINWTKDCFYGG